jgi:hypothetical protein
MSADKGMGSCLIQTAEGSICGRQIEEGDPIGTVMSAYGGPVVGHKDCADAFEHRKREQQMVKIGRQQGAGGPMPGPEQYKEGIMGSIPLEKPEEPAPDLPEGIELTGKPQHMPGAPDYMQPKSFEDGLVGSPPVPIPDYNAGAIAPGAKAARADPSRVTVGLPDSDFLGNAKALMTQVAQHTSPLRELMMVSAINEIIKHLEKR